MLKRMFVLAVITLVVACGAPMQISGENNPVEKAKRAAMCKERCDKKHYPDVKFIRADGTLEVYKINIVSVEDRTACECKF